MSKFEAVLERQREYGLRDWMIGVVALLVVLFHLTAFSTSEPLPMIGADVVEQTAVSPMEMVNQHTAEACGDNTRAADDLLC